MKHTFLILINNAHRMGKYHVALGDALKQDGHQVIYALSDYSPIYYGGLDFEHEKLYVFSDFFKANYYTDECLPDKYKNININKLFFSDYDREIVHYKMPPFESDYYESLMTNLMLFFDHIYQNHKFHFCLYEGISNCFAYSAYYVSKINNASYCGYLGSRLKGKFELQTEEYGSVENFEYEFNGMNIEEIDAEEINAIDEYLKQYDTGTVVPSYHPRNTQLDWNYSIWKRYVNKQKINLIINLVRFFYNKRNNIRYSYQMRYPIRRPLLSALRQVYKPIRLIRSRKYFDSVNLQDDFVLFPIHFKPEASTSVYARHYCDDIAVIRNIAFNLPFKMKLYVKEHFVNYGRVSVQFYKALKQIPNVRLISCEENIKDLIKNCKAVITLTSTVGFEALLMNKLVLVFGEIFYQCHPNCYKIKNYEDLFDLLQNNSLLKKNPEINRKFIAAYRKMTFEGNIYYQLSDENNFVERFKAAMYKKYEIS